jgi:hypothetical protein
MKDGKPLTLQTVQSCAFPFSREKESDASEHAQQSFAGLRLPNNLDYFAPSATVHLVDDRNACIACSFWHSLD